MRLGDLPGSLAMPPIVGVTASSASAASWSVLESMMLTCSRCRSRADSFFAAVLRKPPSNRRFCRPKIDI